MYGVVYIICCPYPEDPIIESLEIYNSFPEAQKRSEEIIENFIDDYGQDMIEHATKDNPVAIMSNGEVVGYAYIVEVSNMC